MKSEIPNIIGTSGNLGYAWGDTSQDGAIKTFYITNAIQSINGSSNVTHFDIDASRSSSCYGNYTEVNPLYNSCKYLISY